MIDMSEFEKIVTLRNQGLTQNEIARNLNLNEKTVRKYLRDGKIPVYQRSKYTRVDPLKDFLSQAVSLIEAYPKIKLKSVYKRLRESGYQGSYRSVARKLSVRKKVAQDGPIFFQREHRPGEIMEGDFTQFDGVIIGGEKTCVHFWIVTLVYSKKFLATPFFGQNFECFLEGSIAAFEYFGGIAKRYRLDNLSAAVKKILRSGRIVTQRYAQFQAHYGFKQDFCNPAAGWEKGSVENKCGDFKQKLQEQLVLENLCFCSLESFTKWVHQFCEKLNGDYIEEFQNENLCPLPKSPFPAFDERIVKVDKFSTVSPKDGHRYSVPSYLRGLQIEARVTSCKIELVFEGKIVASHKRIFSKTPQCSMEISHIISQLCKKPGVVSEWKYRSILFQNPIWNRFYQKLCEENRPMSECVFR